MDPLVRVNAGSFWMERLFPIDIDTIAQLTRLPIDGMKP
jgi:hypothetical protein